MTDKLREQIENHIRQYNDQPVPEFEGLSPEEMHQLIHAPFEPGSPLQLKKLSDEEYNSIPLLNQVRFLAETLSEEGELKLSAKGFLPVRLVPEVYARGGRKEKYVEKRYKKLYKETDSESVHLTHLLMKLSGLVKKRKGKISLTKAGEKVMTSNVDLLRLLLETFGRKLNWAYFDGYGQNNIGQLGYAFTLLLVSTYGKEQRPDTFYSEKYFRAFPEFRQETFDDYGYPIQDLTACYSIRSLERFLDYFGLIQLEERGETWKKNRWITKTALCDKLVFLDCRL